eukprot:COSAG06_NODE_15975_length_1031_cov_2.549356_3_plen_57_part_01
MSAHQEIPAVLNEDTIRQRVVKGDKSFLMPCGPRSSFVGCQTPRRHRGRVEPWADAD